VKPLKFGTLRYHLFKLTHGQALREGGPAIVTREHLASFQHPAIPANAQEHERWILTGDNDLTPA
jgi:hypothetical protein